MPRRVLHRSRAGMNGATDPGPASTPAGFGDVVPSMRGSGCTVCLHSVTASGHGWTAAPHAPQTSTQSEAGIERPTSNALSGDLITCAARGEAGKTAA